MILLNNSAIPHISARGKNMERKLSHLGFPINSNKARLFYAKDSAERRLGTKELRRPLPISSPAAGAGRGPSL